MSTALAVCHGSFGRVTVYQLDRPMRMHAHREGHLIFYLAGPPGIVTISGTRHRVDQYNGVAINPWQPHSFQPCREGIPSVILVAYICDHWLDRDQEGRGSLRFGANRIEARTHIRAITYELAHSLITVSNYHRVDRGLNDLFDSSFEESWSRRGQPIDLTQQRDFLDFRVRKSLRLLDEGLSDGIALDAVARDAGLSRPHFYKLFRENTGLTQALYANTMRVERALNRLVGTRGTVTDIGYELGFSSQSHFTHFFSAHVGIAPMHYRAIARVVSE